MTSPWAAQRASKHWKALASKFKLNVRPRPSLAFEAAAPDAAEATNCFVDQPGGVGAGVVAADAALGVECTALDGVPRVVNADEPW